MCGTEDGETGGLVASSGLNPDEPVLDNVDTTNTIPSGNGVGSKEDFHRVCDRLAVLILKLDGDTLLEVDGEFFWVGWGIQWVDCKFPHVCWWGHVGILKDTSFIRAVRHVLVHAPWLSLGLGDGDAHLSSVVEKVVTALEAIVEFRNTPRGDDLDVGFEGVVAELKADLVVALTCAAMGDGDTVFAESYGDLAACNDRASERGSWEGGRLVGGTVTLCISGKGQLPRR